MTAKTSQEPGTPLSWWTPRLSSRIGAPGDQVADGAGDQHLARAGQRGDPGPGVHRDAPDLAAGAVFHLPGVHPLQEAAARCGQGGFVWLGLFEPGEEELAQVRDTFGLHELAVVDAQNFHMRPKIETYGEGVQLVIFRTARYDDAAEEVEFGEISIFLAPAFVITVRQGVASELRGARQRLEQRPELLAAGSPAALWAILDQVVDDYAPVVAELEHDIDQVEATVFSGASAPTERIYSLRREATDFYRAVHPLLAVVTTIERATEAPQLQPYIRDVHDHLLLVNEEVAAQRDLLGTILEANMAVISVEQTNVSVRQNATVEQLTILATVFLPLTFVTGFFGQNFAIGYMVIARKQSEAHKSYTAVY